jgi:hypothetical protein
MLEADAPAPDPADDDADYEYEELKQPHGIVVAGGMVHMSHVGRRQELRHTRQAAPL